MVDTDQLPQLYARLLQDIADGCLLERRIRSNPRVVKHKMSKFHLKRPKHYCWSLPSCPLCQALALISKALMLEQVFGEVIPAASNGMEIAG